MRLAPYSQDWAHRNQPPCQISRHDQRDDVYDHGSNFITDAGFEVVIDEVDIGASSVGASDELTIVRAEGVCRIDLGGRPNDGNNVDDEGRGNMWDGLEEVARILVTTTQYQVLRKPTWVKTAIVDMMSSHALEG